MKHHLHINQTQLKELGLRNINQAHILDLLTTVHSWAEEIIKDNKVYYWVARSVICEELWILNIKEDTAYRHLRELDKTGLIEYIKIGKKDCIRLTKLGKSYSTNAYVGNKSELNETSEINPKKLGNKSEKNSEINPTYPTTNINPTTNIIKNNKKNHFTFTLSKATQYKNLSDEYKQNLLAYAVTRVSNRAKELLTAMVDYHTSNGKGFKDWSAAFRTWENNDKKFNAPKPGYKSNEPEVGSIAWRMAQATNTVDTEVIDVSA